MKGNKTNILCTRPIETLLINQALEKGIIIDTFFFIETQPVLAGELTAEIQLLATRKIVAVFTSMNAAEAVAKQLAVKPDWVVYCIGGTTKELVYKYFGQTSVAGTAKSAAALAEKIIADKKSNEVFFFCGDHRLDELPELLSKQKITVNERIVYNTIQLPQVIDKEYAGILFFSPTAVHSFFSANTVSIKTILFSIGKTTTSCIRSYCTNIIITSEWPGKENMVKMVINYFEK